MLNQRATPSVIQPSNHANARRHAAVLVLFLALAFLLFLPGDIHATSSFVGATNADPSLHAWFFRWFPYAISAHVNPLYSGQVAEGTGGVNLMWNTWIPLPALVLSPVTLLVGPVAAFDAAVTLGVGLSAWCMYLAAHHFVPRMWPAIAAGAAYGFCPYVLDHAYVGHSNLVMAFVPPLLLIVLHRILVRQDGSVWRLGMWLGLLLTMQFYITEEVLASEAVAVLVGMAVLVMVARREVAAHWRFAARALAAALLVFIPLAAYPLWYQFFGPLVPHGSIVDKNFFVTDLLNLALPTDAQGLEPGFARSVANGYAGNSGEWGGYIGVPMLLLLGYAVWRGRRQPMVRVLAITGVVLVLFSFGSTLHVAGHDTHIPMPGAILAHIPLLEDLLPARFALYVALIAALLLAITLDALPATRRARQAATLALVLIAATYLPPLPFPSRPATTPAFFTASPHPYPTDAAILVVPFSQGFYTPDAMLWQAQAGMSFRMPEGYIITVRPSGKSDSGPAPSATSAVLTGLSDGTLDAGAVDAQMRQRVASELQTWRITGVVFVPTGHHDDTVRAFLVGLLGDAGRDELGATYWSLSSPGR